MATKPASSAFPYSEEQTTGLTKREYFAAMALQGLLANGSHRLQVAEACVIGEGRFAEVAVWMADKLIQELNSDKRSTPQEPPADANEAED
jgi:hypothetical protein